jgi:hypothetical protein
MSSQNEPTRRDVVKTSLLAFHCGLSSNNVPIELRVIAQAYLQRALPPDSQSLQKIVKLWCKSREMALLEYGHISFWDVSHVTAMHYLFFESTFNEPINNWDVSAVTSMYFMFWESDFNQPLEEWDVRNVKNMEGMFKRSVFNQPLAAWDMENVENTADMFNGAKSFNQPLHTWKLSNATRIREMFRDADCYRQSHPISWQFNNSSLRTAVKDWTGRKVGPELAAVCYGHISRWNVDFVTSMEHLFVNTLQFNEPLNDWHVGQVVNMKGMFANSSFNQPLDRWDVRQVATMEDMFLWSRSFNQSLSTWKLDNLLDMRNMFCVARSFKQPVCIEMVDSEGSVVTRFAYEGVKDLNMTAWRVRSDCMIEGMFKGCCGARVQSENMGKEMTMKELRLSHDLRDATVPRIAPTLAI